MIRIEIKSAEILIKNGVSPRTGKPYNIREQEAWASVYGKDGKLQPYPVRMVIALPDNGPAYNPGQYQLDPSCIYVDRFGGLAIARPRLLPLVAKAQDAKVA